MKKLKLGTKILAIIILCLIGFAGIYLPWKKPLDMNNQIKDFTLSKDLEGYREIVLKLSDANKVLDKDKKVVGDTDSYSKEDISSSEYTKSEEKVNSNESLTVENYEKSKSVIEKRLKDLGVEDYNLSMDKQTGTIYMQIPENFYTDRIVSNITEIGSIELKDSENETTYLTSDNLKKAKCFYINGNSGAVVYMELQFNKEGKKILKDLSENDYKTLPKEDTETTADEGEENAKQSEENEETVEQKKVSIYMSGKVVTTTSFDEPVLDGKIDLSMSRSSTDVDEINDSLSSARAVAALLNNGVLPLKYNVEENQYVKTDIKPSTIKGIIIAISIVIGILLIYMVKKYKVRGILSAISYLGFISLYLVILRIFNVTISIESIVGGIIILILNYLANMVLLKVENNNNKQYYKTYLDLIMKAIPILAISIIFVYMKQVVLSSIGMVMFWGIVLILAYNITITKNIVD